MADTIDTYQYSTDPFTTLGLWNSDAAGLKTHYGKMEAGYSKASQQLVELMKKYAANYPSFKQMLVENGYMKPDGSLDYSKLVNKNVLQELDRMWKESSNQLFSQAQRTAMNQAQLRGGIQSAPMTQANQAMFNSARRNALLDYSKQYQDEYRNAQNQGNQIAQGDLNQRIGAMNMDIAGSETDVQRWQNAKSDTLNALGQQTPGFLQNPGELINTGLSIASLFTPAAAAGAANLGSKVLGFANSMANKQKSGQSLYANTGGLPGPTEFGGTMYDFDPNVGWVARRTRKQGF